MESLLNMIGVETLTMSGIAIVVIPVIVNYAKKWAVIGTRYAPVVAFVSGAIFGVIGFYTGLVAEGSSLLQAVVIGIGVGGASTGLYDLQKKSIRNQ